MISVALDGHLTRHYDGAQLRRLLLRLMLSENENDKNGENGGTK